MKHAPISFLILIILTLCACGCKDRTNSSGAAASKPNVLFIAVDDLNDYVNCLNGAVQAHTPNIDRLAASGTLFTNAHCQAPICSPSRASILTGLYPSSTGNYFRVRHPDIQASNEIARQSIFMPDFFENHGYKTLAAGKIFHSAKGAAAVFDEYGGGFDWFGPRPEKRINYDPHALPHKVGHTATDWGVYPEHDSMMTDYKVAAWATRQLARKHERPFFMAAGFLRPHVPWYVPRKWFDMYPPENVQLPPYDPDDFDDIPRTAYEVSLAPMMPTTEELKASGEWEVVVGAYLACVAFVDAQIGKVLTALEQSDYAENTIVIIWADHGYHLGEKNRFAKHAIWERDTRTILAIRQPGDPGGKTCDRPVQLVDMYPTLLELCGLPEYPLAEGRSLVPLLEDPQAGWDHPALSFYGVGNIAVRGQRFRLIRYDDGSLELYDMVEDPNEWVNLAEKMEYQQEIDRLKKYIPAEWAPLAPTDSYDINPHFREKMEERNQQGMNL